MEFYVAQTRADNHAVREAACACIAELGAKLPHDDVRVHVATLKAALIECFRDDSWPVRDAACVACGNFVKAFPGATPCICKGFGKFESSSNDFFVCDGIKNSAQTIIQPPMVSSSLSLSSSLSCPTNFKMG